MLGGQRAQRKPVEDRVQPATPRDRLVVLRRNDPFQRRVEQLVPVVQTRLDRPTQLGQAHRLAVSGDPDSPGLDHLRFVGEHGVEQRHEPLAAGRQARDRGDHPRVRTFRDKLERVHQQILPVGEVVVEHARAHAGLLGDHSHRRTREALPRDHRRCRAADLLASYRPHSELWHSVHHGRRSSHRSAMAEYDSARRGRRRQPSGTMPPTDRILRRCPSKRIGVQASRRRASGNDRVRSRACSSHVRTDPESSPPPRAC